MRCKTARLENLRILNINGSSVPALFSDCSTNKRELEPFPMAIHILKTDLTQPLELKLHAGELVRWVFVGCGNAQGAQESFVQLSRSRRHMFQVAEDAARL